jgi:dipeptidyl aminopeptidase/acylaminoacyl peptidase
MKYFILIFLMGAQAVLLSQNNARPNLVIENIPEVPPELIEQMNQYQNTRSANFLGWQPGTDQMLISTRFGETAQLHTLSQPMGARKQITFFKEPVTAAGYSPDPGYKGLIYSRDAGGNEFSQLYWLDLQTGRHSQLSDGGRSQNSFPKWSNKGDRFVYTSTRRNKKDYDLYLVPMNDLSLTSMILQVSGYWSPLDWSPDDKKILMRQYISINHSRIYILDVATGSLEEINPSEGQIAYNAAAWTADGKGLFIVSDEGTEFQTLRYYDPTSKKSKAITASVPWNVGGFLLSRSRDRMVFVVNEGGVDQLYEMPSATMKFSPMKGLPQGIVNASYIHPGGKYAGFTISTAQTPGDIYTFHFEDKRVTRYTESETGGLDNTKFPMPDLIHYETFDGISGGGKRTIPAFIYKPENVTGKLPVVISIHGGPEGQSRPGFNPFISFLNNEMKVAVILPNVRGSAGYGKSYLLMDNGFKREESVRDIGSLLDWIRTQPDLDPDRVAVMGGSYGGYMTLASMAHFNDRLRCGVDVVGISNFVTFLKNTEDYRKDLRRAEYGDERDPEMNAFLEKISPSNCVEKISRPMLIVQGANDPRVPMSEAEQMKQKLLDKGNETWYLLAKDEGHGFRKKNNVDYYQWSVILFLKKYLLDLH